MVHDSGRVSRISKRDGRIVDFDKQKIYSAVLLAMEASAEGSVQDAQEVVIEVCIELDKIAKRYKNFIPDVEGIQDAVEKALIVGRYVKTAKSYILYRENRAQIRVQNAKLPERLRLLSRNNKKYFRNSLAEFVYLRTYAKWLEKEKRRETWPETVERYISFMREHLSKSLDSNDVSELRESILDQDVMPSMRLLQFAGDAVATSNVCAYNCSYIAPACLDDFAEVMYVSMCGTGVGFSVENHRVQLLPQISYQTGQVDPVFVIPDSKEGWCDALKHGLKVWFSGRDVEFDYSLCRPAGMRLKTMGGKSSGPEPLRNLLGFCRERIFKRQGGRLSTVDVHDILCKIGEIVVSGGVRRSAMISLSDLDDNGMRDAKKGHFYYQHPQRSIANNSAVYNDKPSCKEFLDEWVALMGSGSGERGLFNRGSLVDSLPGRRLEILRASGDVDGSKVVSPLGTNPCGEIVLRSKQFCNLTEVIVRPGDSVTDLKRKVRLATILGTYQSSLCYFPYLSEEWESNCKEERLLGVSLTGQWDSEICRDAEVLAELKEEACRVNEEYAEKFGVNPSTCITCVKPSGTVSQVVDCASGMHPRFADYYIRRIRVAASDSLFKMLKSQGVPYQPEVGQSEENATTFVLEFPVKAPDGCVVQDQLSAIDQLEHWKKVKVNYTEHNPSVTVFVEEEEWIEVVSWVYRNWDLVGGLTFLPKSDHVYQLAPYEAITRERYEQMQAAFAKVDYAHLSLFEHQDETEMQRELACAGGACEL